MAGPTSQVNTTFPNSVPKLWFIVPAAEVCGKQSFIRYLLRSERAAKTVLGGHHLLLLLLRNLALSTVKLVSLFHTFTRCTDILYSILEMPCSSVGSFVGNVFTPSNTNAQQSNMWQGQGQGHGQQVYHKQSEVWYSADGTLGPSDFDIFCRVLSDYQEATVTTSLKTSTADLSLAAFPKIVICNKYQLRF